jgi:hypothetical protein
MKNKNFATGGVVNAEMFGHTKYQDPDFLIPKRLANKTRLLIKETVSIRLALSYKSLEKI